MAFVVSQCNGTVLRKIESIIKAKGNNFRLSKLYLRTISELNSLSTRELSDLGLSKSIIKNAANATVYEFRYPQKKTH